MLAPHMADYMHVFQYESRYPKFTNGQNLKIADFQGADYRKSKNPNFQTFRVCHKEHCVQQQDN